MSTPKIVISEKARKAILRHYAARGASALPMLAARYGISEHYAWQIANIHGVKAKSPRGRGSDTHADPRWKWAIDRGPVIA